MNQQELAEIEARVSATTGMRWSPGVDPNGLPVVQVVFPDGHAETLRVTRERDPASVTEVDFVANARRDTELLLDHLQGKRSVTAGELQDIKARLERVSPGPWRAFLEQDGGIGGSNVIVVSDHDEEPDLYLWMRDDLAAAADFEFVAAARQDIPRLIAAIRNASGS